MGNSKGLRQAYATQDLAFATLCEFRATLNPNGKPHKLSPQEADTLANLVHAWVACQERIRIHRRVPMPGTASPKRKAAASTRANRERPPAAAPVSSAPPAKPAGEPGAQVDAQGDASPLTDYPG